MSNTNEQPDNSEAEEKMFHDHNLGQFDIYHMMLDKASLFEVVSILSKNKIDVVVDSDGSVAFKIPENSPLNIKTVNIMQLLIDDLVELEEQQSKLKVGSKKYQAVEFEKENCIIAIEKVTEIFNKRIF